MRACFARLPWWVGVACAPVAWFGLGHLAASYAGSTQPGHALIANVAGLARWGTPLVLQLASCSGRC